MADTTAAFAPLEWKWLRSRDFDLAFILGIPSISLATIALIIQAPRLFWAVLAIDLWVFGYHHVIAHLHPALLRPGELPELALPDLRPPADGGGRDRRPWPSGRGLGDRHHLLLLAVVPLRPAELGHLARLPRPRSATRSTRTGGSTRRSSTPGRSSASSIARTRIRDLHRAAARDLPGALRRRCWRPRPRRRCSPAGGLARRFRAWQPRAAVGRAQPLHAHPLPDLRRLLRAGGRRDLRLARHQHLAQRAVHPVRLALQQRRFKDGVDPKARLLSYISQPNRLWLYLLVCLGITGLVYVGLLGTLEAVLVSGLSGTVVLYQIVNFHHYVVDATIWKVRKAPMRKTLGLD